MKNRKNRPASVLRIFILVPHLKPPLSRGMRNDGTKENKISFENYIIRGNPKKDVRSQGGEGLSSADIFRTRRFLKCGRPHFLVQKTSDFWYVRMDKGGWGSADKGDGVNFSRICADVFYRRPLTDIKDCKLWMSSYII